MSETNLMLKGKAAIQQTCIPHEMYFNVKHQINVNLSKSKRMRSNLAIHF